MANPSHRYETGSGLPADGDPTWSTKLQSNIESLAVWDGAVYVTTENEKLTVLNAHDGSTEWVLSFDNMATSPLVIDDTVYLGSGEQVYSLDATEGTIRWVNRVIEEDDCTRISPSLGLPIGGTPRCPAMVGETIYFTVGDTRETATTGQAITFGSGGSVIALDSTTGEVVWWELMESTIYGSPAVVDGLVYVASEGVYALDATTGSIEWSYETENPVRSSPTVVDGTVYVGDAEGTVLALESNSGKRRWKHERNGTVATSLAVVDGTAYVARQNDPWYEYTGGSLWALNASTGRVEWRDSLGQVTTPVVVGKSVISFGPVDILGAEKGGESNFIYHTDSPACVPPVVANGNLFLGCEDNSVHGFRQGDDGTETEFPIGRESTVETDGNPADTAIYDRCPTCEARLSAYDNPKFCPECGTETPARENSDTKIYDQ